MLRHVRKNIVGVIIIIIQCLPLSGSTRRYFTRSSSFLLLLGLDWQCGVMVWCEQSTWERLETARWRSASVVLLDRTYQTTWVLRVQVCSSSISSQSRADNIAPTSPSTRRTFEVRHRS